MKRPVALAFSLTAAPVWAACGGRQIDGATAGFVLFVVMALGHL